jgi:MFS transporter, ACS family, hexuronate transporter
MVTVLPTSREASEPPLSIGTRWWLCWLLFIAAGLGFLDRQVLSVLAPVLSKEFGLSNQMYSRIVFSFQASYTAMFSLGGWLADTLGTRVGMALFLGVWSLASASHAVVRGAMGLGAARFLLGIGEGGCFPAATKGATEWFRPERRALAVGIATGGSALGAIVAPPLTAFVTSRVGWRGAFLATGALGLLWLVTWLIATRGLAREAASATEPRPSLWHWLADPAVRWILLARALFDPVFYFYMFWIPQYLARERHMSVEQIGARLWIPFLVLGFSQVGGGRASDAFVRKGWNPVRARCLVLGLAALLTPASWLAAATANTTTAISLMCVLMFAHGFWITNS